MERQVQFGYLKRILSIFCFLFFLSFSSLLANSKLALAQQKLSYKIYNLEPEASDVID